MTTQHFYTRDTVSATFLSSFLSGDVKTAAHCAKELLVSGERKELVRIATFAWLCDDPLYNTANRVNAYMRINETLESFLRALLSERTVTIETSSMRRIVPPPYETPCPSPWTVLPATWTPYQGTTLWRAVKNALKHKHLYRAMYLTSYLIAENKAAVTNLITALGVKEPIRDLFEATVHEEVALRVLALSYASLINTIRTEDAAHPTVEHVLTATLPMGRAGRHIHIHTCTEWGVSIRPESDLMGAPVLIKDATPFWQNVIDTYGIRFVGHELQFPNDEMLDAFYATYFPDDIPDEWPTAERQKSHNSNMPIKTHDLPTASWIHSFFV